MFIDVSVICMLVKDVINVFLIYIIKREKDDDRMYVKVFCKEVTKCNFLVLRLDGNYKIFLGIVLR